MANSVIGEETNSKEFIQIVWFMGLLSTSFAVNIMLHQDNISQ